MTVDIIKGYERSADRLIGKFEKIRSNELYSAVQHFLPSNPGRVLDIGAGTGRDAAWFVQLGHSVVAVEPVAAFRKAGMARHAISGIEWVDDLLPDLSTVKSLPHTFDLVTLSAVWHHLNDGQRAAAFGNIRDVIGEDATVIMSVRHGADIAIRQCFDSNIQRTVDLASAVDLECLFSRERESVQFDNLANGVKWTWMVFRRRSF